MAALVHRDDGDGTQYVWVIQRLHDPQLGLQRRCSKLTTIWWQQLEIDSFDGDGPAGLTLEIDAAANDAVGTRADLGTDEEATLEHAHTHRGETERPMDGALVATGDAMGARGCGVVVIMRNRRLSGLRDRNELFDSVTYSGI